MTTETGRQVSGLGRGLAALIPQRNETGAGGPLEVPISAIARNPYQPRRAIEQQALGELSASIAEHGVLQPILVTESADGYRLVAGERRLRAAQMAGLERIPALVRRVDEQEQLAFALIENLQREDLNPLEEARAFRQLVADFGLTQEDIAARVGRSRSAVANTLRLLDMAPEVQQELAAGTISEGHGRALGGLHDSTLQVALLREVLSRGLSVRQTEARVRGLLDGNRVARRRPNRQPDPDLERLETSLRQSLSTKVTVQPRRKGGRITIEYYDNDDLSRLYERLTVGGGR
jgi:ParB family transcriptional regulator, chromosome partitioning protein